MDPSSDAVSELALAVPLLPDVADRFASNVVTVSIPL